MNSYPDQRTATKYSFRVLCVYSAEHCEAILQPLKSGTIFPPLPYHSPLKIKIMANDKKNTGTHPEPDTHVANPKPNQKNTNETNNNTNTGAINSGNTINSGRSRETGELHTKKGVTGSDSDGQAD